MADNNKKEYPSFYAIIPAYVRYNKSLSPNAKLIFGEITALANKSGYCHASNKYFAEVYGVDKSSVSHWIKQLLETGCIKQELIYADDKPVITERRIYINVPILPPQGQDDPLEIDEDGCYAEECMNNVQEKVDNYASPEGGGEIFHQGGEKTHHGVVKNFNGGGEISPERILQANNTRAVVVDQSPQETPKPPPETTATALQDVSKEAVDKLKLHFAQIDKNLVFDRAFYPKVLSFLSEHDLTFNYISWMYHFCSRKNATNLSGYLFRVLLEPRYIELYRKASQPAPENTIECPVCGKALNSGYSICPDCGFKKEYRLDTKRVKVARILYAMAPDVKKAYEAERDALVYEDLPFFERSRKSKILEEKYGLLQAD